MNNYSDPGIRTLQKNLLKITYLTLFSLLVLLNACSTPRPPSAEVEPRLTSRHYITDDRKPLPLHSWLPKGKPNAVIVALHGFNDYGHFIDEPARFFRAHGIAVYAYDQRGFGATSGRGRWAGVEQYVDDLIDFTGELSRRYPDAPLYVLGESMGGAVAILAANRGLHVHTDGLILAAPAVWARWTMPWYQRSLLWVANALVPWMTLTGDGLGILPSDNLDMLRALSRDPLVIKETRIGAIAGLTDLMDQAMTAGSKLDTPTLYLYGDKDEIIPPSPTRRFLRRVDPATVHLAWYEKGYHMLLRDLDAERYWRDILAWIETPDAPLPSGADRRIETLVAERDANRYETATMQPN
ncbi:alpha/beta hydrolase [Methylohalobius crimeensis]|uniref:alpha/beta hydrolase n=1 Tax=Methylohalobius crimeensis TaxID=244365 RepID=UPI001F359751|nr:alpha/beta hydrolase [Methylohalobius crimeensis]